jgi:glycosyltransferase involved in cell wall biosynthesis
MHEQLAARPLRTVDVVIPCYNYGRYLTTCVESVLTQEHVIARAIILDDASTDDTGEVAAVLARKQDRVSYYRHSSNRGNIATYNEGLLEWSTGDYVVLLSADDALAPGSLSRAVWLMEADPSVGMVYGPAIHFREPEPPLTSPVRQFSYSIFTGREWIAARCRAGHNVITSPEVVLRNEVQRKVGGYRPELPHAGDLEMWLRVAAVANVAYIRRVPQAFYRLHSSNMTRTRTTLIDLEQRRTAFDSFLEHCEHTEEIARLRRDVHRTLAREALWDACRAYDNDQVTQRKAEDLAAFAVSTYPEVRNLPEFKALQRRRRLGPVFCNRTQVFAASAVVHRLGRILEQQSWKHRGI